MAHRKDNEMGNDNGKTVIVAEPGIPQCVITREFDAPPELLFRAYTDPALLAKLSQAS